ncbi:MAG TPA: hypothetical protein VK761_02440, partial [Solirubrobacteraceae bacterium]|nr:hypothetical protein [Solirubrobacteraceae bacterium]
MQFGLVVLGAIVGALSTGGVSFYTDYRRRHNERKVAARVILGDLYIVDLIGTRTTERGRWPENYEWSIPLETWHFAREAFAADVNAAEWAIVDSTFRYIHGVALV